MTTERVRVLRPVEISVVFRDLLGKAVQVKELAPARSADDMYIVATYDREEGRLGASFAVDLPLAASLAAALTLVPPGVADDSIRARKLEPLLEENLQEVLNVAGRFFNSAESPRVILKWMGKPPCQPELKKFWLTAPTRSTLEVSVAGYKGGKIALVAA